MLFMPSKRLQFQFFIIKKLPQSIRYTKHCTNANSSITKSSLWYLEDDIIEFLLSAQVDNKQVKITTILLSMMWQSMEIGRC